MTQKRRHTPRAIALSASETVFARLAPVLAVALPLAGLLLLLSRL